MSPLRFASALSVHDRQTKPIGLLPVHIFLRRMRTVELSKDVLNLLLSESRGGRGKPENKQLLLLSHCKNGAWDDALGYTARSGKGQFTLLC